MTAFTINITGIDALVKKFGRIQGIEYLRPPMVRSVARLHRRMADYPAVPPKSKYRRTGTLGRRWTTRVDNIPGGLQGSVGNNTWYAPLVQSYRFQARHHKGRWINTDRYVMTTERSSIIRDFQDTIHQRLQGR